VYDLYVRSTPFVALAAVLLLFTDSSRADGPPASVTWGGSASTGVAPAASESPVTRARELLARARFLDDAATADEKRAADLQQRLPSLRASAKAARARAIQATGSDHGPLAATAENIEADVVVSEAETVARRREAIENRQAARELRTKAVNLVSEGPPGPTDTTVSRSAAPAATPAAVAPDGNDKSKTGYLTLDTYPWCRVTLAGRVLGETPLIQAQLPAGTYVLTLENPIEDLKKTTEVTIRPGETASKRLAF
jgi:hypothetical protein